jgi:carboxymethylenebutenolidase
MAEQSQDWPVEVREAGPADGPTVLLLHPWWGVREGVLAWQESLARAGARVLLPDLFAGRTADTVEEAEALMRSFDGQEQQTAVEAIADRIAAEGRPWSAVGFSMGAMYAGHLAGRGDQAPERIVLLYGGGFPDGPGATAAQLHLAPGDPYMDDEEVRETLQALEKADITVEQHVYEGAGHWFAEVGSPGYDEPAASLATQRTLAFLGLATT